MDDLIAFLRARLDEDEAAVRAAASYDDGAEHDVVGPPGTWVLLPDRDFFGSASTGGTIGPRIGYANHTILGEHIARHDPARVLREVEAKRRQISHYERVAARAAQYPDYDLAAGACEVALRYTALPYAEHPDYRQEWAP